MSQSPSLDWLTTEIEIDDIPDEDSVEEYLSGKPLKVISSHIKSIRYVPAEKTVEILFKDRSMYCYGKVSQAEAKELAEAPSKGKAAHRILKGKPYLGSKYNGRKPARMSMGWLAKQPVETPKEHRPFYKMKVGKSYSLAGFTVKRLSLGEWSLNDEVDGQPEDILSHMAQLSAKPKETEEEPLDETEVEKRFHEDDEPKTFPNGPHRCHHCGELHVKVVDGFKIRNESIEHQEFGLIASHLDFPDMIPPGQAWIAKRIKEHEKPYLLANIEAQLEAKENDCTPDEIYDRGEAAERNLRSEQKEDYEPHQGKSKVVEDAFVADYCKVDGLDVKLMDGEVLRSRVDCCFIEGGSAARYSFIPNDQIWIEAAMQPDEIPLIVLHEYTERWLMTELGMGYDQAHDFACQVEFAHRPDKIDKDSLTKLDPDYIKKFIPKNVLDKAVLMSARRAPSPGVWVGGKYYHGGEWIPGDAMNSATPQEKSHVNQGRFVDNWNVQDYATGRTHSAEFKAWFGDLSASAPLASKVINDSSMLPLPVYQTKGEVMVFTPDYKKGEPTAYYLNVRNPFDADNMLVKAEDVPRFKDEMIQAGKAEVPYHDLKNMMGDDTNTFLHEAGFDGVTYREGHTKYHPGTRIWEIFSPDQARRVDNFQPYVPAGQAGQPAQQMSLGVSPVNLSINIPESLKVPPPVIDMSALATIANEQRIGDNQVAAALLELARQNNELAKEIAKQKPPVVENTINVPKPEVTVEVKPEINVPETNVNVEVKVPEAKPRKLLFDKAGRIIGLE